MTATASRTRTRRDGVLDVLGVTDVINTPHGRHHLVMWRIGDGHVHDTPAPAVTAASRRVHNAPHGTVLLDGERVNESDLIELTHFAMQAMRDGAFICEHCRHQSASRGALCATCYSRETGDA